MRRTRSDGLRDWLCLARVEEIEKPGDYMTFRIMGEPVIVARNDAGGSDGTMALKDAMSLKTDDILGLTRAPVRHARHLPGEIYTSINAFANVCRHRGVEVASGAGNLKEFSCPYHGWTYDLEGKLVGAPYMKEAEGFDPTSCRLKPIQSALWAGWIFIAFDDDAPAFEDFVGEFDGEFGFLRQEDLRTGDKIVTELNCNWKLVVENLMDFYHAKTLHGTTFGAFVELDMDAIPFTRLANGGFSMFYTSGAMLPGGKPPMGNIPWLENKPHTFACLGLLPPALVQFGHCDNTQVFLTWPLTPETSRIEVYTLFAEKQLERPDFAEHVKKYHDFMSEVVDEDREMVNSLQRNLGSRRFQPGRMSRLEENIHNTINSYLDRVFEDAPRAAE